MSYTQQISTFNDRAFPWDVAGSATRGNDLDSILESAGLANWNIESKALFTSDADRVPGRYGIVRNDTGVVLGVVGNRYRVHQNEEAFAPIEDILDSSDLEVETAGVKNDGQQVFITLKLPEGISIAGEDSHEAKLLAVTSHDGSLATTFAVMIGRLACFNALRPALATPRKFSIRHTANSAVKITEVREALEITFSYVDEFNELMQRWLDEPVGNHQFDSLVNKMLPIREGLSQGRVEAVQDRRLALWKLFEDSDTNTFGRGTKYAAYNALNEYSNWHLPLRGRDANGDKRALRTMDDNSIVAKWDIKAQKLIAAI